MSTSKTSWYVSETVAAGGRPPRRLLLGMMVAVFVSGGVIGSGSTLMLINRRIENNEKHCDAVSISAKILPELEEKLSLSEAQAAQVDGIMKEHLAALAQIRQEVFFPLIKEQFKQMEEQVDSVLDNQQRSQWHAWLEERRTRVCPPGERRRHGSSRPQRGPSDAGESDDPSTSGENSKRQNERPDRPDAGASTKAEGA